MADTTDTRTGTTYVRTGLFVAAMVVAVALGNKLKPAPMYTENTPPPTKLEKVVPAQFAGWRIDPNTPAQIISPELQAKLADLYSDTLTRTYINADGDQVMLSLAYGADQSRSLQVHKPEVCYEGQGFKIEETRKDDAQITEGRVPVMRVLTQKGARNEPVTYWIRSGDVIVRGWFEQNVARVQAGLAGHYPDGILVRVSTIDPDASHAYAVQDRFVKDLLASMPQEGRRILLGSAFLAQHGQPTP